MDLTDYDINNRMQGWTTTGRIPGCGTESPDMPGPGHGLDCTCPPYTCEDCGTTQSQREACGCFTPVEGLPLADLKAIFALGDLSIEKGA